MNSCVEKEYLYKFFEREDGDFNVLKFKLVNKQDPKHKRLRIIGKEVVDARVAKNATPEEIKKMIQSGQYKEFDQLESAIYTGKYPLNPRGRNLWVRK